LRKDDCKNRVGEDFVVYNKEMTFKEKSSSLPCYLVLLRTKQLLQHPILEHPQPTFLPQYDRPSLTPIHNSRQNYSSA
jgi:hypothetical protein